MSQDNQVSTSFAYRHTLEHPHCNNRQLKLKSEILWFLGINKPPGTFSDHKDTLKYLPKHHMTKGLTTTQVNIFKGLEKWYVHEGRTIDPSFLEGTSIHQDLATINFDCLLDIDEQICPRFILEFYATVCLSSDEYGQMSLNFTKPTSRHHSSRTICSNPWYG